MVRTVQIGDVLQPVQVRASQESGAPERIRTFDPQLRKLVLYPLSYERARKQMVPDRALDPTPENTALSGSELAKNPTAPGKNTDTSNGPVVRPKFESYVDAA